jgi:hypothetical protein
MRVRYTDAVSLDTTLRRHVYDVTLDTGIPPTIAELSQLADVPAAEVRDALHQLAAARNLVLQPDSGEIVMAPPFSAVPTPFVVHTSRYRCFANCAWDALGVPVMLGEPGQVVSSCGCCGEAILLHIDGTGKSMWRGVIHFAVPARQWWEDLVFT